MLSAAPARKPEISEHRARSSDVPRAAAPPSLQTNNAATPRPVAAQDASSTWMPDMLYSTFKRQRKRNRAFAVHAQAVAWFKRPVFRVSVQAENSAHPMCADQA